MSKGDWKFLSFRSFLSRVFVLLLILLLLAALWFFRGTLLLAFFAIVIAVGISIPANWLVRHRVPRLLANILSALVVSLLALLLQLALWPVLVTEASALLTKMPQGIETLFSSYNALLAERELLSRVLPPVEINLGGISREASQQVLNNFLNSSLPFLISGGGVALNLLTDLVLVFFLAVLFLVDPTAYVKASLYLVPKAYRPRLLELWGELYRTIKMWLSALFISIIITVSLVLTVLGTLGMPNVTVVAVVTAFATFIPNLGAFLPLIPITVFVLAEDPSRWPLMAVAYLVIQLVESNVLTPLIIKRELSIPAAGMLTFQIIAGLVFGLLGILLAVPLLAIIITLVRELYSYDVLGLRKERLEVKLDAQNGLRLVEEAGAPEPRPQPKRQTKQVD